MNRHPGADHARALARCSPLRDQMLRAVLGVRDEDRRASRRAAPGRIARAPKRAHVRLVPDARRRARRAPREPAQDVRERAERHARRPACPYAARERIARSPPPCPPSPPSQFDDGGPPGDAERRVRPAAARPSRSVSARNSTLAPSVVTEPAGERERAALGASQRGPVQHHRHADALRSREPAGVDGRSEAVHGHERRGAWTTRRNGARGPRPKPSLQSSDALLELVELPLRTDELGLRVTRQRRLRTRRRRRRSVAEMRVATAAAGA